MPTLLAKLCSAEIEPLHTSQRQRQPRPARRKQVQLSTEINGMLRTKCSGPSLEEGVGVVGSLVRHSECRCQRECCCAEREGCEAPPQTCTATQCEPPSSPYSLMSQTRVISTVHATWSRDCPPASPHSELRLQRQLPHDSSRAHGGVPEQGEPSLGHAHLLWVVAAQSLGASALLSAWCDCAALCRGLKSCFRLEQIGNLCNHRLARTRLQHEAVSPRAMEDTCMSTTDWHSAPGP